MASAGIEIERRFKFDIDPHTLTEDRSLVTQWYLQGCGSWTTRCRITTPVGKGGLSHYTATMKRGISELNSSMTQTEFSVMRSHCSPTGVHKCRYDYAAHPYLWELDVFRSPKIEGLRIAEVELPGWDADVDLPSWVGPEITNVRCFSNMSLCRYLNNDHDRSVAAIIVAHHFEQAQFNPSLKIIDILKDHDDPNNSSYLSCLVAMRVAELINAEKPGDILNKQELIWLYTDPDITMLDLALMIAFIRRKKEKKNK